jgi:hypothetical protein
MPQATRSTHMVTIWPRAFSNNTNSATSCSPDCSLPSRRALLLALQRSQKSLTVTGLWRNGYVRGKSYQARADFVFLCRFSVLCLTRL